jgi:hypothetical protein
MSSSFAVLGKCIPTPKALGRPHELTRQHGFHALPVVRQPGDAAAFTQPSGPDLRQDSGMGIV